MRFRTIGLIANPAAGRGRGPAAAQEIRLRLEAEGFAVRFIGNVLAQDSGERDSFFRDLDLLVIAGGDGTLMRLLPELLGRDIPVYMLPTGNESLFAKLFRMSFGFDALLRTMRDGTVSRHYVPTANGIPFFTMVSIGLDSEVVAGLATTRRGPIRRLSYVLPTVHAALRHRAPRISLRVDHQTILSDEQGFLIIANNPQYALQLGFVPEADSSRQELCARFFPYRSLAAYLLWCSRAMPSRRCDWPDVPLICGKDFEVEVDCAGGYPVQADGESIGRAPFRVVTTDRQILVLSNVLSS